MRFAINWSPEAAALLEEGKISFDLYKCPDWPELLADAQRQKPAYVHFPIGIGRGESAKWDFATIHNWLSRTDTRFVNSHILPHQDFFSHEIHMDDLIAEISKEIELLTSEFGAERVTIENCPDILKQGFMKQGIEPEFFQALVRETGCGLLLDISHAHITCNHTGRDLNSYLNAMPIHTLRELHVTGMGEWSNGIYADHKPMTPPDWERFEYCMGQIASGAWRSPEIVAFEYGGIGKLKELCGSDGSAIETQVPRLYATVLSSRVKA